MKYVPNSFCPGPAERHVVAQNVVLDARLVDDGRQGLVRLARGIVIIEFDVVGLGAADDLLLLRRRYSLPSVHVMQVFLHDHVASAGETGILLADQGRSRQVKAGGICRAVDKAEQVARVEVAEARYLVDHRYVVAEAVKEEALELEAQVGPFRADVEQEVAGASQERCGQPP